MFSWQRARPALLGIDISPTAVKVVELASARDGIEVRGHVMVPLPAAGAQAKPQDRVQNAGQAIRRGVRQLATRLTQAATAVPSAAVISKTMSFPATLSEDDIEAQIELEAEQYIPYPLEDVSLDFCVLGPAEKAPGLIDVQIVASRREYVEDRAAALEWAGLKAVAVDVESLAMERACHRVLELSGDHSPDEVYAICDSGALTTSLIVIRGRQVIYAREQGFGGQQLNEAIQRRYGLNNEDAERFKKQVELAEDYRGEILAPFVEALGQQINRALHFFGTSQPQVNIRRLFLAGGCAVLTGLEGQIDKAAGLVVERIDPFLGCRLGPRALGARLIREAPSLLVATGLALRGFE